MIEFADVLNLPAVAVEAEFRPLDGRTVAREIRDGLRCAFCGCFAWLDRTGEPRACLPCCRSQLSLLLSSHETTSYPTEDASVTSNEYNDDLTDLPEDVIA